MKITVDRNPQGVRRYQHLRPAPRRDRRCGTTCPDTSWTCTLERGHRGPHVSHSWLRRVRAVWDTPGVTPRVRRRTSGAPTGLPTHTPPNLLDFLGDLAWRALSSAEEIALIAFFLAFVWFGFEWLVIIFS